MATGCAALSAPAARAHPRCFFSSPGVRAVGERAWSTRLPHVSVQSGASGASGVSSRHAKRGGAAPAAASPRWWDVKARLETALRGDERSEFGYLEHDSEGETVFRARSKHNGDVRVVEHGPWRSLRFNEVEQGLSYVRETTNEGSGCVAADLDVLGYEYLRCMTAAAAATCALDKRADWTRVGEERERLGERRDAETLAGSSPKRGNTVVCVGLGSGAMPAFIANAFPELSVDVVEIDDVVVDAAEKALGLPGIRATPARAAERSAGSSAERFPENLSVVIGDAAEFMASAAAAVRRGETPAASTIFLDAFDGDGETPTHLTSAAFLRDCAARVKPGGVVVANCFNGVRGSKARHAAESFAVALAREIGPVTSWTVETPVNVIFAARKERASSDRDDVSDSSRFSRAQLRDAARALGAERLFEWDAGDRVRRAFWVEVVEKVESAAENAGSGNEDGENGFPRVIRERPAGIEMNPLSALAERVGTTMPREWAEDEDEEA